MNVLLHSLPPTHTSAGDSWTLPGKSESVSCGGHCSFLLGPSAHRFCLHPPRVCFPILCELWWLCGGVNLLQEGLCHTQVCCTQSLCPYGSPLLTCTSTGDAQTQFCLSLCGVSGSWCTQGSIVPSKSAKVQPWLIQGIRRGDSVSDYLHIYQRYKE